MTANPILLASMGALALGKAPLHDPNLVVLHNFKQADGQAISAGLTEDSKGNLYGSAAFGGAYSFGDIYELELHGVGHYRFKDIYDFQGSYDGVYPSSKLVMDTAGNLYGTAIFGGQFSRGTVFELSPGKNGGWAISNTYDFKGDDDGGVPATAVTLETDGNIVGTTSSYGQYGNGTIFEITPAKTGWTEKPIHQFKGKPDGAVPATPLHYGYLGDLYGTTKEGGKSGLGVVFRLLNGGKRWQQSVIHSFTPAEQVSSPLGALAIDGGGDIYGAASGAGGGAVYELSPPQQGSSLWYFLTIHTFSKPSQGLTPGGGVSFDEGGTLYGVTTYGGRTNADCQYGCGLAYALFQNETGAYKEYVLARFGGRNGALPMGELLIGNNGLVFGTTYGGGTSDPTAYSLMPF